MNAILHDIKKYKNALTASFNLLLEEILPFNSDLTNALPLALRTAELDADIYYSTDKQHVLFNFWNHSGDRRSRFYKSKGDVTDFLIPKGLRYQGPGAAISFENVKGGYLQNISVSGMRSLTLSGYIDVICEGLDIQATDGSTVIIEFGIIVSVDALNTLSAHERAFTYLLRWWNYYREHGARLEDSAQRGKANEQLELIRDRLKAVITNFSLLEKDVEQYLTDNRLILEVAFNIPPDAPFLPQQSLINYMKETYDQDLQPDLIYKDTDGNWQILDDKRSKGIVKNLGSARASATAQVDDLKTQLKYYREFFDAAEHRKAFSQETGYDIPLKPKCKGLVGYLQTDDELKAFNHTVEDYPAWIEICTYNMLCARFSNFVEHCQRI
ncbi:MAG TPA: hypothetical protein VKQ34_02960 [Candidatus Saccharimonadales bacterium]|nr:hypothetical protein [Candidatus Saccharimonadales bacterium]